MAVKIQLRRDTYTNWENENPILSSGEIGVVIDFEPILFKIGNGIDNFLHLPYANQSTSPYKKWVGLLSYDGSFTTKILENDLGTITWSNPANATIQGSSNALFTVNKSFALIGGVLGWSNSLNFATSSMFGILLKLHDGTTTSTPYFTDMPVEIRVYD